jgi:hypothetical protein
MKQETLEEAAEKYSNELLESKTIQPHEKTWIKSMFIYIVKWQQERMYSEAIEFAEWIRNNPYVWNYSDKLNDTRTTEELFEQFKKK